MTATVVVAQKRDQPPVGEERNVILIFYGVEERDERDGNPIVSPDAKVTANDDPSLAWDTTTKHNGRSGADPTEVYRRMPCSRE
jgi:hypothetical protein